MTVSKQPLLGAIPEGMPDPNVAPPQVARAGDPFASLRIVVGLSRVSRNVTHQLRDVVTALNAAYLDWSFDESVVLAELVQLQSNWSISFHGEDRIVIGESERGRTVLIVDSTKMSPFLVTQAQAQAQACDDALRAFARDEDNY
ncbi:MAG TPA: hypothetical protein VIC63_02290 [Candidatus Limnocylindria bacterium]